ncbi:M48 family metallopeptidase [soil metagenome]
MISAIYFDSVNGKRHQVDLNVTREAIHIFGEDITRRFATRKARLGEPFAHAPCVIDFEDRSRCEIYETASKQALLSALDFKKSFVQRLQEKWAGALAGILFMLFIVFAAYHWGVPWAAENGAALIPIEVEKRLGEEVLSGLDKGLFKPTVLSDERIQQVQDVFQKIQPARTRMPMRLEFRDSTVLGPNAFALPNGTIVMTDAMVNHIAGIKVDGKENELTVEESEQLAGVLAHEIGHVQSRHSLKNLLGSSVAGAMSWALFGDFSAVVAGAPVLAVQSHYSRGMETAADDYAAATLKQHGMSPNRLADFFASMQKKEDLEESELPSWMRTTTNYVSTHPASKERMARLRLQALSETRREAP